MNYLTSQLKTLISDSTVATAAGLSSAEWASSHVFTTFDLNQFCYSMNIGRLPMVAIQELTAGYQTEATSPNEIGGTVTCAWTIRIMTSAFSARREANYSYLQRIKQAILKKIGQEYSFELRNIEQPNSQINPMATYIDITIEAEHTFTDTFNEE
jgi:hypothetical protein